MAVSVFLLGLPLIILIGLITAGGGSLTGASANYAICNPNSGISCQPSSSSPSVVYTVFNCNQGLGFPCKLASGCVVPPYPPPAYCTGNNLFGLGPALVQETLLPAGASIAVPSTVVALANNTQKGVFFGFGTVGTAGFITLIGIIVGIVSLAGLTVFGTGAGTESVHILFMGGLFLGVWIFLSGLEGFVAGSPASFFTELNVLTGTSQLGTALYVLLTFVYLVGFAGMVKRGN